MAPTESRATDELMRQAFEAYRRGAFGDVLLLSDQTLTLDPGHLAAAQLLATAAGRIGDPSRGVAALEALLALRPSAVDAYLQLAGLLRRLGRVDESITQLEAAVEIDAESFAAHNDLGLAYLARRQGEKALASLGRAAKINSSQPRIFFNIGLAHEYLGNVAEAAQAFQRATATNPEFVEAQLKLGHLLWAEGADPARVIDCFQAVIRARPGTAVAALAEAKILMQENRIDAAEKATRRAIELAPQDGGTYCFLAGLLMQQGRFHEAAAAIDSALAHDFWLPIAYCQLAHIKRIAESDRPLIARIEWLLREPRFTEEHHSEFHFALGKAYDDIGEFERAIQHFDEGNREKRRGRAFDAAGNDQYVGGLIRRFTPEFLSQNAGRGLDSDLPVFIVGMPRSGTTLVEQILSSHPEIAAGGELRFWMDAVRSFRCDDRGFVDPDWIGRTGEDYLTLLRGISSTARRVTDKRPLNFQLLGLIRIVFPNALIIHCRRHPVDTCLSIYFQNFATRIDFAQDRGDIVSAYRAYSRLMTHWRQVLPAERFLELEYENVVAESEAQSRRMIAFCGLDWDEACLWPERNRRPVQTASVWQARQALYKTSVERWRGYEPWLGPLRELLSNVDEIGPG